MGSLPAVIIAAGSSSRLGQPKQLLMLDGETLLERAIRVVAEAGASPVLVVVGAHREEIEAHVHLTGTMPVGNPAWQEGIASSIRAGIEALGREAPESPGVLLMICDQPAVTVDHLRQMLAAFQKDPFAAVASVYAGRRGIPAIFPRAAFACLLALRGDQGARGLLSDPALGVIEIPLPGGELDIDRPEDLQLHRTT